MFSKFKLKKRYIILAIIVLLIGGYYYIKPEPITYDEFNIKIEQHVIKTNGATIPLKQLTNFEWDEVCSVFGGSGDNLSKERNINFLKRNFKGYTIKNEADVAPAIGEGSWELIFKNNKNKTITYSKMIAAKPRKNYLVFTNFQKYLELKEKNKLPEKERNFCHSKDTVVEFFKGFPQGKEDKEYYSSDDIFTLPTMKLID